MNNIGDKIKKLRESKGVSQEQLASDLNISKSALWNYENNKRDISLNLFLNLYHSLGEEVFTEILSPELFKNIKEIHELTIDMNSVEQEHQLEILKIENEYLKKEHKSDISHIKLLYSFIHLLKETMQHYDIPTDFIEKINELISSDSTAEQDDKLF